MDDRLIRLPLYQIDAFSDRVFGGNPAAICPLTYWLPDTLLQAIAAENNLAETAFFVPEGEDYALRWFTPTTEVDLCGHATLASAFVVFRSLKPNSSEVRFHTLHAGVLSVRKRTELLEMDFPARPAKPIAAPEGLIEALGKAPIGLFAARDVMAVYASEEDVLALKPDLSALAELDLFGVIATAPGTGEVDFVSRFFAPRQGVPEDPVTGSAHCTLIPYWAEKLGKTKLEARQLSRRRGALSCAYLGDRVTIAGHASLYLEGSIRVELR